jgi:hypothetical protein
MQLFEMGSEDIAHENLFVHGKVSMNIFLFPGQYVGSEAAPRPRS